MKAKTRLAVIIGAAILILGIGSAIYMIAHSNDISFTEKTISGQLSEADGLVAERGINLGLKHWDSTFTYQNGSYSVENSFKKNQSYESGEDKSGADVFFKTDLSKKEDKKMREKTRDEYDATCRPDSYFYARYTLYDEEAGKWKEEDDIYSPVSMAIREYFKVPTDKCSDLKYTYNYDTGDVDQDYDIFCLTEKTVRDYHYLQCEVESLYNETYTKRLDPDKTGVDPYDIAAGYGLYQYNLHGDEIDIENVFSPDGEEAIIDVEPLSDEKEMMVITYLDKHVYGYVLQQEDAELKQKIDFGEGKLVLGNNPWYKIWNAQCAYTRHDDNYDYLITDSNIFVLDKKDGKYEEKLAYSHDNKLGILMDPTTEVAFDGKRLAVMGVPVDDSGMYDKTYGFELAVIENDEVKYSGKYECSLDSVLSDDVYLDDISGKDCLRLSWEK